jgi:hypothetical protein
MWQLRIGVSEERAASITSVEVKMKEVRFLEPSLST